MTDAQRQHMKESPISILVPLVLLAIPSVAAGFLFFLPALNGFFGHSIFILPQHDVVAQLQKLYHSPWQFLHHGLMTLPFWLAIAGVVITWLLYVAFPSVPEQLKAKCAWLHRFLVKKYWVDDTYDVVACWTAQKVGKICWRLGDVWIIDRGLVNGSGRLTRLMGVVLRRLQTGYLYHYAFAMVLGLVILLGWVFWTLS